MKRIEQLYAARDKALEALVEAADVPAPEGVVQDEVEQRKQAMVDQLRADGRLAGRTTSTSEDKTEEEFDAELANEAAEGCRIQLLLDAFADAEEISGHRRRVRARDRAPGRSGPDVARSSTTTSWSGPGWPARVFGDVRRGKALGAAARAGDDQGHRRQP